ENTLTSVWLWVYLLYVTVYFGISYYLLYRWAKSAKHKLKRKMAVLFILLDTVTILCGVVTDVILPLTQPLIPAMASIVTALFGIGYFTLIYKHDLFNINLVISSDAILQISNNSNFVMDENKELLKYSPAAERLLGYQKGELMGADFMALAAKALDFNPLYAGNPLVDVDARLRCKDGTVKDVLLSASVARDQRNSFLCIIVSCQDVSKQKRTQAELELERENYKKLAADYQRLAYFDPLTGLPNRRYLFDMLNVFEQRYCTEQKDFAVLFLDLDNFKHANDLYGHKGGDELLVAAAKKLQSCIRPGEFVARLGGDEFMVIMPYHDSASLVQKVRHIRDEFHETIPFHGEPYEIGISSGYGVFSQIGDTTRLMQAADEAMYGNKKGAFSGTFTSVPDL
ncbi:MAG: diguanylate cyclase, partial [Oscillospiraceae bacterium]